MNRNRSFYRRQRKHAISRKVYILRQIGGENLVQAWARGATGRFSKGKIHCSCRLCRLKSCDAPSVRDRRAALDAAQQLYEFR